VVRGPPYSPPPAAPGQLAAGSWQLAARSKAPISNGCSKHAAGRRTTPGPGGAQAPGGQRPGAESGERIGSRFPFREAPSTGLWLWLWRAQLPKYLPLISRASHAGSCSRWDRWPVAV
jgi:hypothetical protein